MSNKYYDIAKEKYLQLGVDSDQAIKTAKNISLSLHCWQGDDVGGFETPDSTLDGGGIQVTGNHPGKARSVDELRSDLEKTYSLIPGNHRLNLHAIYGEFGGKKVDRDEVSTEHFKGWVEWAKENNLKLDFNATCFSHPKADTGFTLSSKDKGIRDFWIEHVKRCRNISAYMGEELGSACVHNVWIPDGSKDIPVDRAGYRHILKESLDSVMSVKHDKRFMRDAVESKLFGIGSESFVVGSHEFYLLYAQSREIMPCFDLGHFHLTESVADKISALFEFQDELLLHVSRPVRWDSDHVVILNDDIRFLMEELVRSGKIENTHIGMDYFDATLNRIGAWALGVRSTQKALLMALLQPFETLKKYEAQGANFERLALLEELKSMPFGAVWDQLCEESNVMTDRSFFNEAAKYEKDTLLNRK